jgi:hypothetical protein
MSTQRPDRPGPQDSGPPEDGEPGSGDTQEPGTAPGPGQCPDEDPPRPRGYVPL